MTSDVRPLPAGKKRVSAPAGHCGVGGPGTYARIAEIMSGRANSQQRQAATCKDLLAEAKAEGGRRVLVWRMSP